MITIKMKPEAARPVLPSGDANPLWPFIIEAQSWGVGSLQRIGDYVYLVGITNTDLFSLDMLKQIMGGAAKMFGPGAVEVLNYPAWIEADKGGGEVPASAPWADIETDGKSRRPTFAELRMAREVDGKWYAPASDGVHYFDGSALLLLDAMDGYTAVARPPEQTAE